MVTVACVLNTRGGKSVYDPLWVKRLHHGVDKYMNVPYEFVCLSDVDVHCDRIPLEHLDVNVDGWWSKLELFRPGQFIGPVLYLDLDTLIVGSLDSMFAQSDFRIVRDFLVNNNFNSSVMSWSGDDMAEVYKDFFEKRQNHITEKDIRRIRGIGDQAYIQLKVQELGIPVELYEHDTVVSYKKHLKSGIHPSTTKVIAFHGRPKMNETTDWTGEYWRSNS